MSTEEPKPFTPMLGLAHRVVARPQKEHTRPPLQRAGGHEMEFTPPKEDERPIPVQRVSAADEVLRDCLLQAKAHDDTPLAERLQCWGQVDPVVCFHRLLGRER